MDTLDSGCHQCGKLKAKSFKDCHYRDAQTCPYVVSSFNVPPSFVGRSWLDYTGIGVTIALALGLYFLFTRIRLAIWNFSIPWLNMIMFLLPIYFLFIFLGSKGPRQKNIPFLKKQLTHYFNNAQGVGFVAYEQFGLSTFYGVTTITPITFKDSVDFTDNYPASLLAVAELTRIEDLVERMLVEQNLSPQIVQWTLVRLAAQDIIHLNHIELVISKLGNKSTTKTLAFVTPRPKLLTYKPNGYLESRFVAQLKQQTNADQAPIYWGSLSVYELVYNLYKKPISAPNQQLLKQIVKDATSRGWAEPTKVKGFKAKMQSMNVVLWRLAASHDSRIVAERKILAMFYVAAQNEYKKFFMDVETAVQKAILARRRKSN
ncbi:hypothetical protein [Candidatus Leptofilum sp.]|uniref:hypothetical protein n=1 Tax=Candidatus Leptofilum sp. TaxID=3241576 RepID=UPI003B5B81F9